MKTKVAIAVLIVLLGLFALIRLLPERSSVRETWVSVQEKQFSERLRIAGDNEESVAASLIEKVPSILGLRPEALDSSHRDFLATLVGRQNNIRKEFGKLQVDLEDYTANSRNERCAGVLHDIQRSEIDAALRMIQERITMNHSFPASEQAKLWSDRIRSWADQMVEAKPDK